MLPTEALNDVKVWEALIEKNLPLTALIRQLPRLTNLGFFEPFADGTAKVVAKLTDEKYIKKSRVHPLTVLTALRTYASGVGTRNTWEPSQRIIDALDKMFYLAFENVEPTNKKYLIGLDISGSMGWSGSAPNGMTAREITSAIAAVLVSTEPEVHTIGFTGSRSSRSYNESTNESVTNLDRVVAPRKSLASIMKGVSDLPFGSTDCALPMLYALEKGLRPEVFIIMTDNDTYAGRMHPSEALEKYRRETGIDAKLIVLATTAEGTTITDPQDKNSIDIAGFDSAVMQIISGFARGDF
jgi:60 kDa SS-A/Ro ribonucleoprotein